MNCYVPDAFHKSTTKVRIFIKQRPIKSEKSLHLPLKMVRKKSEFSIFESEFNSGSTVLDVGWLEVVGLTYMDYVGFWGAWWSNGGVGLILHNHSLGMGGQGSVYDWAHKASLDQLFGRGLSEGGGTECVSWYHRDGMGLLWLALWTVCY